MNDLKQALENAGVDELELAKQRIISLEETVKELNHLSKRQILTIHQRDNIETFCLWKRRKS